MMLWNLERNVTYYKENVNHLTLLSPFAEFHRSMLMNEFIRGSSCFFDDHFAEMTGYFTSFRNPGYFTSLMKWICGYIPIWCNT